jgi:hypothetical protein
MPRKRKESQQLDTSTLDTAAAAAPDGEQAAGGLEEPGSVTSALAGENCAFLPGPAKGARNARGTGWDDLDNWPLAVGDYATGLSLLQWLWSFDRAYSIGDLTAMAQARFELSRKRRLPGHYYHVLRKMAKSWRLRETQQRM